jgi:hypothetical protein
MINGSSKTLNRWNESEHLQILGLCRTNRIPGIWILDHQKGVQPIRYKVQEIFNIKAPKTKKSQQVMPAYWYIQLFFATCGFAEVTF